MSSQNRPLSPHLQVYRPQITSVLSITHRITGVALSLGTVLLAVWLIALAGGPQAFAKANAVVGSIPGQVVLFGFTLAVFYHLCNGIRHLFWDAGYGFELPTVHASGKAVVAVSVVLTVVLWVIAKASGGAA